MSDASHSTATIYPWLKPLYNQLTEQFIVGKLHHALLIHGVKGLGKSQLAKRLALFFQCRHPEQNLGCGHCQSCRLHAAVTHPDCYFIAAAADKTSISIEQIRLMQAAIVNTGLTNQVRVVVVEQAELMTTSAANALLKVLEEPPKDVYFILTCSQRTLLPATVVSRCVALNAASAGPEKLAAWVSQRAGLTVTPSQLVLFNNSPLGAVAGLSTGLLDYAALLRVAMLDVVCAKDRAQAPLYPLIALVNSTDIGTERALGLIHLMIIDCVKIASGISVISGFEFTQHELKSLQQIDVKKLLSLEQGLNQLKQLCIAQPATNKVLQLQRVIVEFMVGS
jgi:DNA polymerase-3 subunit delta'